VTRGYKPMSQAGFDPMIPTHSSKLCVTTDLKYNVQLYSVKCVIKHNKKATIQHLHLFHLRHWYLMLMSVVQQIFLQKIFLFGSS